MGPKSKKSEKRKEKEETARKATLLLFSRYYLPQYGQERWNNLLLSLNKPIRYCALINKWANDQFTKDLLGISSGECIQLLEDYQYAYVKISQHEINPSTHEEILLSGQEEKRKEGLQLDEDGEINYDVLDDNILSHRWPAPGIPSSLDENGMCCYYPMDGASLLPVIALNISPDSKVYDMCAAPGGKSLVITSYFTTNGTGTLTCSDISPSRRLRLQNTLRRYLPSIIHSRVNILAGDATSKQFYSDHSLFGTFDRILVDAPCSSERHVLQSPDELSRWSSGRSKLNSERQYQLLYNALKICAIHGRVVYSTCSLSQYENDDVVNKVVKKINKKFYENIINSLETSNSTHQKVPYVQICSINPANMPFGEPTEHGWHILPDRSDGWGPIYFSVMEIHYKEFNQVHEIKKKKKSSNSSLKDHHEVEQGEAIELQGEGEESSFR